MSGKYVLNFLAVFLIACFHIAVVKAQRLGEIPHKAILHRTLISNGPRGPIQGGESAVTDMILAKDGWVYGSTKATWGAENCHIFRTDSGRIEHVLNLTSRISGQTIISGLEHGRGGLIFGATSTYNEVFDDKSKDYDGGHIFSFDPATRMIVDFGVIARRQGINCIVVDSVRRKIYGVTYPAGHLFSFDIETRTIKDIGEIMTPWRVKDLGRVSWRGVPKVLMLDDAGTLYFSTYYRRKKSLAKEELMKGGQAAYSSFQGGRIYQLAYGDTSIRFTGAVIPVQASMDSDPIYENGIASAIRAREGGYWCGTINDGFLFKFDPSTSRIINKGKTFQYWNLKSLAYGNDGKLYMLGGRDEDNSWIMSYDPAIGSLENLGWLENTAQCSVICADKNGRIIVAENLRHSFIWALDPSKIDK